MIASNLIEPAEPDDNGADAAAPSGAGEVVKSAARSGELADSALAIPRQLGDFAIIREVGRGGMGVVFEALEVALQRRVALKVLPVVATLDVRHLDRFRLETQLVARMNHPNILPIYSVGHDSGISYFAMPLVQGRNLAEIIQEIARPRPIGTDRDMTVLGPAPRTGEPEGGLRPGWLTILATDPARSGEFWRAVAALGAQVAGALAHSHGLGILHRDIKPANLMFTENGHLWLTDFGLARFQDDNDLTRPGDLIGTIRYMSPEQAAGRRDLIDGRTDVYSLGMTLHELLTRRPAFPGSEGQALIQKMATEDPPPLRTLNPAIPVDLETIVIRATARWPTDRYLSAAALGEDLQRFAAGQAIGARRPSALQKFARWSRQPTRIVEAGHSLFWFGVALTVINAASLGGFLVGLLRPPDNAGFLRELAIGLVVFNLPVIGSGVLVLRRKRGGLTLGVLATIHFLALNFSAFTGWIGLSYGGITEDLGKQWPYGVVFVMLSAYALARATLGCVAQSARFSASLSGFPLIQPVSPFDGAKRS